MVAAGQSRVSEWHGGGAVQLPGPCVSQTAFPRGARQAGEGMGLHLLGLCLPPPKLAEHWELSRCDPGRYRGVIPAALRCSWPRTRHRTPRSTATEPPRSARPRSRGPGPARDRALPGSAAEAAPLLGKGHGRGPSAAHPRSPRQQRTGPGPRGPLSAPRGKDAAEGKGKRGKRSVPEAPGAGCPRMARPGLTGADGASTAGRGKRGRGLARKR